MATPILQRVELLKNTDPFKNMPKTPKKVTYTSSSSETDLENFNEPKPSPTSSVSESGLEDRIESATKSTASLLLDAASDTTGTPSAGVASASIYEQVVALGLDTRLMKPPTAKKAHDLLKEAQRCYPPEACVLVGNLPANYPDGMLILFVEYEFMAFGTCNVAVFRKCEYKPYAIVQFEKEQDAVWALAEGHNMLMMGRRLRVEMSRYARYL